MCEHADDGFNEYNGRDRDENACHPLVSVIEKSRKKRRRRRRASNSRARDSHGSL